MGTGQSRAAIVGLGMTPMRRRGLRPAPLLALDALTAALDDAGVGVRDVDGLLVSKSPAAAEDSLGLDVHRAGFRDLRMLTVVNGEGTSAAQMVQLAALAVSAGANRLVACVFADAPTSRHYNRDVPGQSVSGSADLDAACGVVGAPVQYALATRRHMALYGTTSDDLGSIAVATRAWAARNPLALFRDPLTLEQYHESRWVAEPLRLLDCCMPVDGAIAVLVAPADDAGRYRQPPVHVLGMGQGHRAAPRRRGHEPETSTGGSVAGPQAFRMAGLAPSDVTCCQLYDAFTYMTLVQLEDYGLCAKGEAGDLARSGALAPRGAVPTNTGGGSLSGYYMQGMTPISEAVVQARGQAGSRQVAANDCILVTGLGGILEFSACLIVSPHVATS